MQSTGDIQNALTENTFKVFEKVSKLNCIKDLVLCGGTAQALQLFHRKSEDLDFELLGIKKERPNLNTSGILSEIQSEFPGSTFTPMGENHFLITLPNSVKLSFFKPKYNIPSFNPGFRYNNIITPSLQELLGMKLYTITQRIAFRDYYDIYALLKKNYNLHDGILYACNFSKHEIHSKDILGRLTTPDIFQIDKDFEKYNPKYKIGPLGIKLFLNEVMLNEVMQNQNEDKIIKAFKTNLPPEKSTRKSY